MYKLIVSILLIVMGSFVAAHVGSHTSDITIRVMSADFTQKSARISLQLKNEGKDELTIKSINTDVGSIDFALNYPLSIKPGASLEFNKALVLTVKNKQSIPQIFTLIFDFGEAGKGPVTIIPTSFQE